MSKFLFILFNCTAEPETQAQPEDIDRVPTLTQSPAEISCMAETMQRL